MRKKPDPAIVPLQSRMFEHGIAISEACKRAHVNPTTWSRWASGGVPDMQKLRDMESAVDAIIAEEMAEPAF